MKREQTSYFPKSVLFYCMLLFMFFSFTHTSEAATIHEYSDRLGDSAPNASSTHTITFKTMSGIPAGGSIEFIPDDGDFTIPATDFDIDNVALYVSTTSGYHIRAATGTADAAYDGVAITPGTSGNIEITLNSTVGIPSGAYVRMLFGTHTPHGTSTDENIYNPPTTGTFDYTITTTGTSTSSVIGKYAILDRVSIPAIDTRETDPPFRFNGAPAGTISGTTLVVEISFETDEFARCRYSSATDTPYSSMGNEFSANFTSVHSKEISVATNTTYTFFVRCVDDEGNVNTDDYVINFTVPAYPEGIPGSSGEEEGEGSGTGSGSGQASPGDGSPSGNNNSSGGASSGGGSGGGGGGGSGGSSGGSGGGGGFEGTERPYQSGDGSVTITGYAFPRSEVVILVDGQAADRTTSSGGGSFSVTLDEIARGAYTFGVYAVDKNGVRSSTFSTTFTVTGSRGSTLSNINVMPSISVNPNPVEPGTPLSVRGYAIPDAVITVENQNDKSSVSLKSFTTTSDSNGAWSLTIDTGSFSKGTYKVRAKARQEAEGGVSTNFSNYTFYGVGESAQTPRSSDLNRDSKVNLTDFSILLFWWNTDGGNSNPPADINGDGKVSLTDFSIMIFNWTG